MIADRECRACGKTKTLDLFAKNKQCKYGREHICQACRSLQISNKRRDNKLKAIKYKGNRCARCQGEFHPAVYDFHHIDMETKEADPGSLMHRKWSRLKIELDKCILLCANCHRLTHAEVLWK